MVVIVAVMLGIFGGVMASGIMKGWIAQRIHASIYNEISHVQIHNPEFMLNEDMNLTIENAEQILNVLDTIPEVVAYSPRVKLFAMVKSDWSTSGLYVKGVDRDKEIEVSEIYKHLLEGDFLEGKHRIPSIVIGSDAAKALKLLNYQVTPEKIDSLNVEEYPVEIISKLGDIGDKRFRKEKDFREALTENLTKHEYKEYGDKLVEYFSFYRLGAKLELTLQDTSGQIINPVFKIRGIYKTSNTMFDGLTAFVDRQKLNTYTKLGENDIHEIAIISTGNDEGKELGITLEEYFAGSSVMGWDKISPEIAMYTQFTSLMGIIFVGIILFALAFGIINTMLMSVLERVKELGMLMAIGMNRKRVFYMIMAESIFLTITGAIAGMIFSGIILEITGRTGINFNMYAEGFEALGYSSVVYPTVSWFDYISIIILVIITGIISSIWPARKALKLNPVEALRTD